ncbi:MAG: DUF481 domain-containing protein [Myxococcota bacterium]|nr:DUF481 domain-containing protein [Myxococcota bacterium]
MKIRGCVCVLAAMVVLGSAASAQAQIVNVLSKVSRQSDDGVSGELSLSSAYKKGNINLRQFKAGALAHYKAGDHLVSWIANGRHLKKGTDDSDPINRTFQHIRYRYFSSEWFSAEGFVQYEYDEGRNLQLRTLLGGGPRFSAEVSEDLSVALGMALMIEREIKEGKEIELGDARQYALRSSNYVEVFYKWGETLGLQLTAFYQPLVYAHGDNSTKEVGTVGDDRRILLEPALQMKANSYLGTKLAYRYAFNSRPFTDEDTDHAITSSLTLSF